MYLSRRLLEATQGETRSTVIENLPERPLTSDDVKAIAKQEAIQNVYGMVTGDASEESHGFDINIGLNVDGGLNHDFFFDLVITTGDTVTVVAYPRPMLPSAEEVGAVDDPMEVVNQEKHEWEVIYRKPREETSIEDIVAAFDQFRTFSDQEKVWVEGLAQSGVLEFINH